MKLGLADGAATRRCRRAMRGGCTLLPSPSASPSLQDYAIFSKLSWRSEREGRGEFLKSKFGWMAS